MRGGSNAPAFSATTSPARAAAMARSSEANRTSMRFTGVAPRSDGDLRGARVAREPLVDVGLVGDRMLDRHRLHRQLPVLVEIATAHTQDAEGLTYGRVPA